MIMYVCRQTVKENSYRWLPFEPLGSVARPRAAQGTLSIRTGRILSLGNILRDCAHHHLRLTLEKNLARILREDSDRPGTT